MKIIIFFLSFLCLLISCKHSTDQTKGTSDNNALQKEVQDFLDTYNKEYVKYYTASSEAEWLSNTHIVEGDTMNTFHTKAANEQYAQFLGNKTNIDASKKYLGQKDQLTELQWRQLETILFLAGDKPETASEIVKERIAAEVAQTEKLYGYKFMLNNKELTPNDIDNALKESTNLATRLSVWKASKEIGKELKPGLLKLRDLRNKTVQALDYADFFSYQVSEYGLSADSMMADCHKMIQEVWPLYRELHTYARYELAKKYKAPVPDLIPAHWLQNRWGQDWSNMVNVEGFDLDKIIAAKGDKWCVEQSERFYMSLGFDSLPESFYEKSDLYVLPKDAKHKKNTHASAWHLNLNDDVRSLMSIVPNAEWYETTHHEFGHIYYYLEYSNPNVPPVLRKGANRAYHEAIGSMMGLAAMQKPFLQGLGLIDEKTQVDHLQLLLKEALNFIVFIPWSAGVMSSFEYDLYHKNLSADQLNKTWWNYVKKYQGIVPPEPRDEMYCDAASKTHINDDAAQYYDYALSFVLLFQIHDHISRNILKQAPQTTNYYGNKAIGKFLHDILSKGATADGKKLLKDNTGEDLNAKAMLRYFAPLMSYLKEVNKGRTYSLSESI
ncbi:MAG: M2 family metallopeptidase [Bacteroidota bacterium]|nr:M2 family metallopeptidase [Bacteroidota bacterium]